MLRYFIDPNGKAYKAIKPRSPEDMERLNPSQEQLDALPDDGSGITEIERNAIMADIVPKIEEIKDETV